MNEKYNQKIYRITELGVIQKQLSEDAINYLCNEIGDLMEVKQTDNLAELLPDIIQLVFNRAYSRAIEDSLQILREK